MMIRHKNEHGYSLVELSIVLIIVGLLVGGVVAGQTLIQSARLKNTVSEADNYKKAVLTFRDQYQYLPGDIPNASDIWGAADGGGNGNSAACQSIASTGITTCNGNNDGMINSTATSSSHEKLRAWQHLSNAGFIEGQYTGAPSGGELESGVNSPPAPLKGTIYEMHFQTTALFGRTGHFVKLGRPTSGGLGANDAAISPTDARSIDLKYDDARADSGDIMALDAVDIGDCVSGGTSTTAPSDYILTNTEEGCRFYFWWD